MNTDAAAATEGWCVYILRCSDDTLYTGITNRLTRRLTEHAAGRGSRYVRSRLPFVLTATFSCGGPTEARRLEWRLKRLSRPEKLAVLALGRLPAAAVNRTQSSGHGRRDRS